jgi:hypothetical protein
MYSSIKGENVLIRAHPNQQDAEFIDAAVPRILTWNFSVKILGIIPHMPAPKKFHKRYPIRKEERSLEK